MSKPKMEKEAKKTIGVYTPTKVKLETPEELERTAEILRKEAEFKRLQNERNELSLNLAILHRNLEETKGENNALETRNIGLEDDLEVRLEEKDKEIERLQTENEKLKLAYDSDIEQPIETLLESRLSEIKQLDGIICKTNDRDKCVDFKPFNTNKCKGCNIAILRRRLGVLLSHDPFAEKAQPKNEGKKP